MRAWLCLPLDLEELEARHLADGAHRGRLVAHVDEAAHQRGRRKIEKARHYRSPKGGPGAFPTAANFACGPDAVKRKLVTG